MSHSASANCVQSKTTDHQMLPIIGTDRVTQFHCPCCEAVALEVGKLAEVEVCFCPQCKGFVIDSKTCGSLTSHLRASYRGEEETPKPLDHKALELQVRCPACCDLMEVHPYYGPGNAVIDSCRHCKLVWFNEKELEQIVRAPGLRVAQVCKPSSPSNVDQLRERDSTSDSMDLNLVDVASSLVRAMLG